MFKKVGISFFLVSLFVSAEGMAETSNAPLLNVLSAESVESKDKIINQVIDDSGMSEMSEMIEQLPAMVAMGFDQQPAPPISRHKFDKFRASCIDAFSPEKIRKTVKDNFGAQYEEQRFSELLTLVNSPLAKKMTALEVEAGMPEAQQEMMRTGNVLMGQLSPERLVLIQTLDEAMSATEMGLDMQMMMAEAMMTNMNKIVPSERRMTADQLEDMLSQMRLQSRFPARQYTELNFVYAYRTASDAELSEYAQLYQSELGRWSVDLMRNAWLKVSANVAVDLAEKMEKDFIEANAL